MQNLGIEDMATFKAATGLSGGLGRTGESACGALTAGVMAIGLVYGRDRVEKTADSAAYQEAMRLSGILCDRFQKEFGGTKCHDVQLRIYGKAWNMRDATVYEDLRATMSKEHKCADVTGKAARLAAEIILGLE